MSDFLSTILELLDHERQGLVPPEAVATPTRAAPIRDLPKPAQAEESGPISPIPAGRLITYRGSDGKLCGGDLDRAHGTVVGSQYGPQGWTFTLTDGQTVSMSAIRGVARTSPDGALVEGWTVRRHGLDGEAQ